MLLLLVSARRKVTNVDPLLILQSNCKTVDWKKIPWHFCCDGDPGSFFLIRTFNLTEKCLHLQIQDSSWHSSAWCFSQITSPASCIPLNGKSEQHTKISYVLAITYLLHTSKVRTQMLWMHFMCSYMAVFHAKKKKEKIKDVNVWSHPKWIFQSNQRGPTTTKEKISTLKNSTLKKPTGESGEMGASEQHLSGNMSMAN